MPLDLTDFKSCFKKSKSFQPDEKANQKGTTKSNEKAASLPVTSVDGVATAQEGQTSSDQPDSSNPENAASSKSNTHSGKSPYQEKASCSKSSAHSEKSKTKSDSSRQQSLDSGGSDSPHPTPRFYSRPEFLKLTRKEEKESKDVEERPIVSVRGRRLPLNAGYAECGNDGVSYFNEDQASVGHFSVPLRGMAFLTEHPKDIDVQYFAIFCGNDGSGASLIASRLIEDTLMNALMASQNSLLRCQEYWDKYQPTETVESVFSLKQIVTGAFEVTFDTIDDLIDQENYPDGKGGCSVLVAIFLLDRLFVASAGDGRAIALCGDEIIVMAEEVTPERDFQRLHGHAYYNPGHAEGVNVIQFMRTPLINDLSKTILCQEPAKTEWTERKITERDIDLIPLVTGTGRESKLLNVAKCSRGLGHHDLKSDYRKSVPVKPFMSSIPEVTMISLESHPWTNHGVLVMGCSGLWQHFTDDQMRDTIRQSIMLSCEGNNPYRYDQAAINVVHKARGDNTGKGFRLGGDGAGTPGSLDDITVFVIPLYKAVMEIKKP